MNRICILWPPLVNFFFFWLIAMSWRAEITVSMIFDLWGVIPLACSISQSHKWPACPLIPFSFLYLEKRWSYKLWVAGGLQFMGSQRARHNLATKQQQQQVLSGLSYEKLSVRGCTMHKEAAFSRTGECCLVKVWFNPSLREWIKMLKVAGLEGHDAARRCQGYLFKTGFTENQVGGTKIYFSVFHIYAYRNWMHSGKGLLICGILSTYPLLSLIPGTEGSIEATISNNYGWIWSLVSGKTSLIISTLIIH